MAIASPHVAAIGVTKAYGDRPLFDAVTLSVAPGARVGLIGDNGSGKSTFLRVLAGNIAPDDGKVVLSNNVRLEWLEQAPKFHASTVFEALAQPLAPLRAAIDRYSEQRPEDDGEALLDQIERLGGWEWEHKLERAAQVLHLGDLQRPCDVLSGGFNKRLALARLWLTDADVMLLDEPTNHLDVDTIAWLEGWLASTRAAVVVVTHDRAFLDGVATTMAELRDGRMNTYVGNYSDYLISRAEEEALASRTQDRQRQHLRYELAWARASPKARTSKNRARLERVEAVEEKLAGNQAPVRLQSLTLSRAPRLGNEIMALDGAQVSFDGRPPLFAPMDWRLCAGDRWGIVGPNGVGKTSLLRLIAGDQEPQQGSIKRGKNTKVGYFDQHRTSLDESLSVTQTLVSGGGDQVFIDNKAVHVSQYLERFGFPAGARMRRVAELSGGEKNRLALALFLLTPANLLLFDEPTNDLDLMTLGVLERALTEFSGCMLVVSHDRTFLDRVVNGIVAITPQAQGPAGLEFVRGGYNDYLAFRAQQTAQAAPAATSNKAQQKAAARADAKANKSQSAGPRMSMAEKKELAQIEATIEKSEGQAARDEAQLADATLWRDGGEAGRALQQSVTEQQAHIRQLYERWQVLLEKEQAQNG